MTNEHAPPRPSSTTSPAPARSLFRRSRVPRQAVHHRWPWRHPRRLRGARNGNRSRAMSGRARRSRRGDGARRRHVLVPRRIGRARQRHRRARARFRRHAALVLAGSHFRAAHASDDSSARGQPRHRRTARRIGTPASRGISHWLRGRVQDGGSHRPDPLSERLPFVGDPRHLRRHGQRGEAARPEERVAWQCARDRLEHELRHPPELRHHDQAAARGPRGAERRDRRGAGGARVTRAAQDAARQPVGLLPRVHASAPASTPARSSARSAIHRASCRPAFRSSHIRAAASDIRAWMRC